MLFIFLSTLKEYKFKFSAAFLLSVYFSAFVYDACFLVFDLCLVVIYPMLFVFMVCLWVIDSLFISIIA